MPRLKNHKAEKSKKDASKPKEKKAAKPPVRYSEELGNEICDKLARGQSLNSICKDDRYPSETAVRKWALNPDHPFSSKYAPARELGYHRMADEIVDIADDATNDFMVRKQESGDIEVVNHDHISRSRLRIETRKWMLSKMLPKIYGDKLQLQGDKENPIQHEHAVSWMTKEEAEARGWA